MALGLVLNYMPTGLKLKWCYTTDQKNTDITMKIDTKHVINIKFSYNERYRLLRNQNEIIRIFTLALQEMGEDILESMDNDVKEDEQ